MNQQNFDSGYMAYQSGDWQTAATMLGAAKDPGEVSGRIDHLLGNALMKLGRFDEAADAYAGALADTSYGMVGALSTNRGRALLAAGRMQEAVDALNIAATDPTYATPYKAYLALGSACRALGDVRGAGIAYRNAAIDESNPDPSASLRKLGGCFMDLGRPSDAVESYRTAIDFSNDLKTQSAIYCDLALAYVAANRMPEAVDAFDHATANGTMSLSPEAQAAYDAARNAVAARSGTNRASETDDLLAAAGYGGYADPLDPTGETSGDLMPSPEDTGFFSVTEEEIIENDRRGRRKRGHAGRIIAVILILLLLIGGAAGFAYYSGFGWPTQESVAMDLFAAKTNQDNPLRFVTEALGDEARQQIVSSVPSNAQVTVGGVNRSMRSSEVVVNATLAEGGEESYKVSLVRDGIGWKVSGFEPVYASLNEGGATYEEPVAEAPVSEQPVEEQPVAEEAPAEGQPAEEVANDDAVVNEGEVVVN